MPARLIHTRPPLRLRVLAPLAWCWRRVRMAYLRWWLGCIEAEHDAYAREPHAIPAQLAVFRLAAQAVRARILTLENQQ